MCCLQRGRKCRHGDTGGKKAKINRTKSVRETVVFREPWKKSNTENNKNKPSSIHSPINLFRCYSVCQPGWWDQPGWWSRILCMCLCGCLWCLSIWTSLCVYGLCVWTSVCLLGSVCVFILSDMTWCDCCVLFIAPRFAPQSISTWYVYTHKCFHTGCVVLAPKLVGMIVVCVSCLHACWS